MPEGCTVTLLFCQLSPGAWKLLSFQQTAMDAAKLLRNDSLSLGDH